MVRGLDRAEPDDLIMISDVDELIRPAAMRQAQALDGYIIFDMAMYQFYLNLRERPRSWWAAYAFKKKYIDRITNISVARWDRSRIKAVFREPEEYHVVSDAGWHFTHLGGIDRLQQKFSSYSHNPDPWPQAMMKAGVLKKHIAGGGVVGDFKHVAQFVPIDDSFPEQVVKRQAHYRAIGFIKDVYDALGELQIEHRALKQSLAMHCYDDPSPHPALFDLPPKIYARMSGLTPPFLERINALKPTSGNLLSRGRHATQSSLSPWSNGATLEEDASGAVDGRKTGHHRFHTAYESQPWWMVDLAAMSFITEIHIFNRLFPQETQARAARLKIEVGANPESLVEVYRKDDDEVFGGADGKPLVWRAGRPITGRYLRIGLLGAGSLHLDQVEVFGTVAAEDMVAGQPTFTSDWFSGYHQSWTNIFRGVGWDSKEPRTVIELGCFEGRASLWILDNLLAHPASRLHCVDVFPNEDDPISYSARHRRNIQTSARANMVVRHAQYSYDFLLDFVHAASKADFIYVDASHRSPEVLEDLTLAFQSLKVGGVMICDDYLGGSPVKGSEGILSTPKMAIDVFTTLFNDRLQIIRGQPLYQLAFTKTAGRDRDDPSSRGM